MLAGHGVHIAPAAAAYLSDGMHLSATPRERQPAQPWRHSSGPGGKLFCSQGHHQSVFQSLPGLACALQPCRGSASLPSTGDIILGPGGKLFAAKGGPGHHQSVFQSLPGLAQVPLMLYLVPLVEVYVHCGRHSQPAGGAQDSQ